MYRSRTLAFAFLFLLATNASTQSSLLSPRSESKDGTLNSAEGTLEFEAVSFRSGKTRLRLHGTLTRPKSPSKPLPAILIIQGGGAQNRDGGAAPLHLYYRDWALMLGNAGYTILRMDRRGIGTSEGNYTHATTDDFADDAVAAIDYLKSRDDVDGKNIGIIGHCEGGLVGCIAAARVDDLRFLVLMAPPGLAGDKFYLSQWRRRLIRERLPPVEIAKRLSTMESILVAVKNEHDDATLLKSIRPELVALKVDPDDPGQARRFAAIYLSKWFRHFIAMDPDPVLRKVPCSTLVVHGQKDWVVDITDNLEIVEGALKAGNSRDVTVHRLPGLNHRFQACRTGSEIEYEQIAESVSSAVIQLIVSWIEHRAPSDSNN